MDARIGLHASRFQDTSYKEHRYQNVINCRSFRLHIGSVTASKFLVTGVEVGEKALFRAYAQRGNRRSDFSNQAVIWDSEGPGLSLAA